MNRVNKNHKEQKHYHAKNILESIRHFTFAGRITIAKHNIRQTRPHFTKKCTLGWQSTAKKSTADSGHSISDHFTQNTNIPSVFCTHIAKVKLLAIQSQSIHVHAKTNFYTVHKSLSKKQPFGRTNCLRIVIRSNLLNRNG